LALPEFVAGALKQHRARQAAERLRAGPRWQEHNLVFASTIGTPRSAGNVRRDFRVICEKAGLGEEWSPRELRRLPARAEAGAQDRRRADGPDLQSAIMNLAVSLAVR
jgi:hypothetical protein